MPIESVVMSEKGQYVAVEDAALEVGVNRSTMYYYMSHLSPAVETKKFPIDRRSYILRSDLDRIKDAKRAATEKQH